jgi:hypothetical protein
LLFFYRCAEWLRLQQYLLQRYHRSFRSLAGANVANSSDTDADTAHFADETDYANPGSGADTRSQTGSDTTAGS